VDEPLTYIVSSRMLSNSRVSGCQMKNSVIISIWHATGVFYGCASGAVLPMLEAISLMPHQVQARESEPQHWADLATLRYTL